jgi:hypothetical protein
MGAVLASIDGDENGHDRHNTGEKKRNRTKRNYYFYVASGSVGFFSTPLMRSSVELVDLRVDPPFSWSRSAVELRDKNAFCLKSEFRYVFCGYELVTHCQIGPKLEV